MDYGGRKWPTMHQSLRADHLFLGAAAKGVDLAFRIVPGGTHSEASWARQIPVL